VPRPPRTRWRLCCSGPLSRDIQFVSATKPESHGSRGDLPRQEFSFSLDVPFTFAVVVLYLVSNSRFFEHKVVLANSTRFTSWEDPLTGILYPSALAPRLTGAGDIGLTGTRCGQLVERAQDWRWRGLGEELVEIENRC